MCRTNHYELVLEALVAEASVGASGGEPRLVDGRLEELGRGPGRVPDDHPAAVDPLDDLVAEARARVA